jgi:CelD/BcsL family acetyltransferase involved in cellulose biosynthesis
MKVHIIPGHSFDNALTQRWREIQASNPSLRSPFFSPGFTACAASVFEQIEIAVIKEGTNTVAIFPYERTSGNVAIPVGRHMSDYHGLISAQGFQCNGQVLLRKCGLNRWNFDHLPFEQTRVFQGARSEDVSPLIDLSRGFASYSSERQSSGSELFSQYRMKLRRVERDIGEVRFEASSLDKTILNSVLAWKSSQYVETGLQDLFQLAWARTLLERVFDSRSDDFSGVLSLLYAGEHLIAGHFGMRSQTVWHWWFPAYNQDMAKYSPGLILLVKMAEFASNERRLCEIDLGKGLSTFKSRFMNRSNCVTSGSTVRPFLAFRTASRQALARFINTVVRGNN